MSPATIAPEMPESLLDQSPASRFGDLRGVRWRINLGVLPSSPSSTIDDLRRFTADSRRRYANLRKCLLSDPHFPNIGDDTPDLMIDNPLSQNPDSTWGRFFRNAALEQMVNKDLSRLYPEHESYFQTPGCQALLRRILLLWCLRHPECGYRQGMHELLAPLLYVLHADLQHLSEVRKLYEDHFVDKFDEVLFHESHDHDDFNFRIASNILEDDSGSQNQSRKHKSLKDLDSNVLTIVLLNDPYGAEGELGIVLSKRFMEHDAYSMFDTLMSGAGGVVAMEEFFAHLPESITPIGLAPVIEASSAVYHLLSIVDSSLYSHLVELGVEPQYFGLRWLRVLFGREFALEELLVIWDEIFLFDNCSSIKPSGSDQGVLNSPRGAFISAMAVSMILNLRSSLLATEHATTCLRRLLNFPKNTDLGKLIEKAKSLVSLALESNGPLHSTPVIVDGNRNKQRDGRAHTPSLSFDSSFPNASVLSLVPEKYWEEKWKVLHEEEETKRGNVSKNGSSKKMGWREKIKLSLSRSPSDASSSKRESGDTNRDSSIRRNLLEDLSQQLVSREDIVEVHDKLSTAKDSHGVESDIVHESVTYKNNRPSDDLGVACEEHCSVSDQASLVKNVSEKSGAILYMSSNVIDNRAGNSRPCQSTIDEPPLPISNSPDADAYARFGPDDDLSEPVATISNEKMSSSGRFQWFRMFGRHSSVGRTLDKRSETEDSISLDDGGEFEERKVGSSAEDGNCRNLKTEGYDQNLICSLRNLGQSMLENIQVIELAFEQERNQVGSLDRLSKHTFVEQGQVTAITALKELRKISSLLRDM